MPGPDVDKFEWEPSVDDIGRRLYARTLTADGKREGTFSERTRPTATAVAELIDDAVAVVASAIGENVDDDYWPQMKAATISYVAMSIEAGYYPESTESADSAFRAFQQRFNQQIEFLEKALGQRRPNERRIVSIPQRSLVGVRGGRLDPWANDLFP